MAAWQRQLRSGFWWIVLGIPYMGIAAVLGHADWRLVAIWAPLSAAMNRFVWLALRRGWTFHLKDPSLTLAQVSYSIASTAACYAMAGPMRAIVLPMVCLALIFSIFALPPRQVRWLAGCTLALFAVVMVTMAWLQPERYPWPVEVATFSILLLVVPGLSLQAQRMSELRATLGRQKSELTQALARIAEIAERDELTGLPNRRRAQEALQALQAQGGRGEQAFLALIDLDHFKQVNDVHGHAAGDEVLRHFAQGAAGLLRQGDLLARWGGEEFLLVLRTADAGAAERVCERLRRHAFATPVITAAGASIRVTVSIGLARHAAPRTVEQTLAAADAALYVAKATGRDRVSVEPEAPSRTPPEAAADSVPAEPGAPMAPPVAEPTG
jgi:diguanylate cyclase (GGDEF)-like protein